MPQLIHTANTGSTSVSNDVPVHSSGRTSPGASGRAGRLLVWFAAELDAVLGIFGSYSSAARRRVHIDVNAHTRDDLGLPHETAEVESYSFDADAEAARGHGA